MGERWAAEEGDQGDTETARPGERTGTLTWGCSVELAGGSCSQTVGETAEMKTVELMSFQM